MFYAWSVSDTIVSFACFFFLLIVDDILNRLSIKRLIQKSIAFNIRSSSTIRISCRKNSVRILLFLYNKSHATFFLDTICKYFGKRRREEYVNNGTNKIALRSITLDRYYDNGSLPSADTLLVKCCDNAR